MARDTDYVARWGGEEFLCVLCFTEPSAATHVADRIMAALWVDPFEGFTGAPLTVTGSMGFALFPPDATGRHTRTARGWRTPCGAPTRRFTS